MPETTEQRALRDSVRGLVARHQAEHGKGVYDLGLWQRLCGDIGIAGLAVPERFGGAGAGPVEVQIVQEELGRALAGTPMLGSAVLATQALLASGDDAACARLLPQMADGSAIAALAWTTAAGRWDPAEVACQATRTSGDAWDVSGDAEFVLDGDNLALLLVPAMTSGGIELFEVQPARPEVTCTAGTSMDQTRRLAAIRLAGAAGRPIGAPGGLAEPGGLAALRRARDLGCIALSGEQAGAAARALEITIEYAKARVQFGRPIASFQALQHRMADLHVLVQSALSVSRAAAEAAQRSAPGLALRAATAKAYCSEAFLEVTAEMLQLHGAIAMTWEHEAHRYFKRARGAAMLLGTPAAHVATIAASVVD